jgi:hypothetical protein
MSWPLRDALSSRCSYRCRAEQIGASRASVALEVYVDVQRRGLPRMGRAWVKCWSPVGRQERWSESRLHRGPVDGAEAPTTTVNDDGVRAMSLLRLQLPARALSHAASLRLAPYRTYATGMRSVSPDAPLFDVSPVPPSALRGSEYIRTAAALIIGCARPSL